MNRLNRLFSTSIGRKLIVAITGALLIVFLVVHMLGNMTILKGQDATNAYANWLQGHPFLWVARIGLIALFGVHIFTALRLAAENRRSRRVRYRRVEPVQLRPSSRLIVLTGITVLAFLIYHLLHFTFGVVDPEHTHLIDEQGRHDVYAMIVHGFRNPWISLSYIVAMLLLGAHLVHGAKSLFQTLGLNHETYTGLIRGGSLLIVLALVLGNISLPVIVMLGWTPLPS